MDQKSRALRLPVVQLLVLTLLRVVIGWHFLYEGIVKLLNPNWTCAAYLAESRWFLADVFHWIVANPAALRLVDFLNVWGLILIGLGLIFGFLTRGACISGIALLALYYVANPPLIGYANGTMTEGNYLVVDKNFVELIALVVLAIFPAASLLGVDRFLTALGRRKAVIQLNKTGAGVAAEGEAKPVPVVSFPRRELIKSLATLPFMGGFIYFFLKKRGWDSYEEKQLIALSGGKADAVTSATIKTFQFSSMQDLKGKVPHAKVGKLELSRLILGGNLAGGWAHARDLIYASSLVKAYHTDQKVFDTFKIAEQCGINTFLTNPVLARVINKYWRARGGKIQFISDCAYKNDAITGIKMSVDGGAHACYIQGGISDKLVQEGKVEEIGKALDFIRQNGLPAGIGAHALDTVKACVDKGLKPDFWVKTLHHIDYWSAKIKEENDNIWCTNPEETIAYMNSIKEPWIAFKTLAAGAIHPKVGFPYAFKNGADFVCVGMYDFQIVDDVNLALDVLNGNLERKRPWMA